MIIYVYFPIVTSRFRKKYLAEVWAALSDSTACICYVIPWNGEFSPYVDVSRQSRWRFPMDFHGPHTHHGQDTNRIAFSAKFNLEA